MDNVPIEVIANAYLAHKKEISLGPFIVAQFLDAFFLGLVVMQVSTYFANRREQDGWIHKLSVVGVFLINLTTSILAIYWIYDLFVVKYGTFAQFLDIKTLFWFYITNGIGTALVQLFFVRRESQLPPTIFAIVYLIEYNVIAPKTPYVSVPLCTDPYWTVADLLVYHRLQGKFYAFSLLHTLNARDSINTSAAGQLPSVWKEGRGEKALSRMPQPFQQSRNDSAPAADRDDVYPYFASVKVTTNTYIHRDSFDNIPVDTLDFRQSRVHNRIRSLGDDSVITEGNNNFVIPLRHNAHLSATQRSSGVRPTEVVEIDLVDMNSMHKRDSEMESIDLDQDTDTTIGTPCRDALELIELQRAPTEAYGAGKHVAR
ncbi:hypothetical protein QFC21_002679 [Naganishia friedmannii]|uniref:Uncharacterized protein n=1 Tax=Naganishia friedmannii TaxID=89922 RepID=A0ACC2VXB9_9TREE|nr:hypothetical protein QFC21_002679 [Naganishia friedmannii]